MPTLSHDVLEQFAAEIIEGMGAGETAAAEVADSLVTADLRGHASHGIMRLPWYDQMRHAGALNPGASPEVEYDGVTARVAGSGAFGQLVGRRGVEAVTAIAGDHGIAVAGVRNGAHLGRIGEWAEHAAERGILLLAFVNGGGSSALVAAPGTADPVLSTNPIAIGVPTFGALDFPVVLDIATSQVANGKLRERRAKGEPLPEGWTVTDTGDPVTDPEAYFDGTGALLPLGGLTAGYKGFGLGVMAEFLAGLVGDWFVAGQREVDWPDSAAAFIGIDPCAFSSREAIEDRIVAIRDRVGSVERSPTVPFGPGAASDVGVLPGEPEHRVAIRRREGGIPIPTRVADDLIALAIDHDRAEAVPGTLR